MNWCQIYNDEHLTKKYLIDDIKYCINMLEDAGFIKTNIPGNKNRISLLYIEGITWEGHKFIDSIRDEELWTTIKSKIGGAAKVSVSLISQLAYEVGYTYLKSKLGIS